MTKYVLHLYREDGGHRIRSRRCIGQYKEWAELATGAVPFAISRSMSEKLRMFVVGTDAKFIKRAKGRITFRCDDVMKAREAIEESMESGKPVEVDLISLEG